MRNKSVLDRLMSHVQKDKKTKCWRWISQKTNGYGIISFLGKPRRAHRICYELLVGPIPDGLDLDHLCRVRDCVNPEHLEPVTRKENLRRAPVLSWVTGGIASGKKKKSITHCPRGHEYSEDNTIIYERKWDSPHRGPWRRCKECHRAKAQKAYWKKKAILKIGGQ